ncbi:MAG: sulfatase, partial [Rhodospirillaceae bacterium]|nr:sulfatase [Rhodospirillaceae bacterium]
REMLSGRPNFLHRSWGPFEPFDDSLPKILSSNGIFTHLTTDHAHYFEDGGLTYHTQYDSWEFFRGQEGDPWIGQVADPEIPDDVLGNGGRFSQGLVRERLQAAFQPGSGGSSVPHRSLVRQDWVNRGYMTRESRQPQARMVKSGLEFIHHNADQENWFLQIETFDPHEPFFTQSHYKEFYAEHHCTYRGKFFDWPRYEKVDQTPQEVEHLRYEYAALVSMCDAYLGQVLDCMDEQGLWEDTMLIVCTDHGFLLGEHDWWGKCSMPFYDEVARTPFFVWDPRFEKSGERRSALVQPFLDMAPTLLGFFGLEPTQDMLGYDLVPTIESDTAVRESAIFGIHGGHVNITDGHHVYMHAPAGPANGPLYQYTLMPTHMRKGFALEDFADMTLAAPFSFTKDCQTMKITMPSGRSKTGCSKPCFSIWQTTPGNKCRCLIPARNNGCALPWSITCRPATLHKSSTSVWDSTDPVLGRFAPINRDNRAGGEAGSIRSVEQHRFCQF